MDRKTPKKVDRKRFVRYKEGAEMYSMCQSKFEDEEGVDLMPANIELSAVEINLVNALSREVMLKCLVERIKDDYDYVIIP